MTYYCAECVVNWHPYQCPEGRCPECGRGTRRQPREPASLDADARFAAAMKARADRERSEHSHRLFDAFCAKRDAERAALLAALDADFKQGEAA